VHVCHHDWYRVAAERLSTHPLNRHLRGD
jgi:hypothetical protein